MPDPLDYYRGDESRPGPPAPDVGRWLAGFGAGIVFSALWYWGYFAAGVGGGLFVLAVPLVSKVVMGIILIARQDYPRRRWRRFGWGLIWSSIAPGLLALGLVLLVIGTCGGGVKL